METLQERRGSLVKRNVERESSTSNLHPNNNDASPPYAAKIDFCGRAKESSQELDASASLRMQAYLLHAGREKDTTDDQSATSHITPINVRTSKVKPKLFEPMMLYCMVQMHGQSTGFNPTALSAKLCQGIDTGRSHSLLQRPFCLSCSLSVAAQSTTASSSAVLQRRGNMKR
ncbi:hypothetical protein KCU61_g250, partial [Aureobasidium melanogenum]